MTYTDKYLSFVVFFLIFLLHISLVKKVFFY